MFKMAKKHEIISQIGSNTEIGKLNSKVMSFCLDYHFLGKYVNWEVELDSISHTYYMYNILFKYIFIVLKLFYEEG